MVRLGLGLGLKGGVVRGVCISEQITCFMCAHVHMCVCTCVCICVWLHFCLCVAIGDRRRSLVITTCKSHHLVFM